jgi:putative ABC transport system permease protein
VTRLSVNATLAGHGYPGMSSEPSQRRSRAILVGVEVALAFVLLTTAVLLAQSLLTLTNRVAGGFDSSNVVTAGLPTPLSKFETGDAHNAYLDELASRLHELPGVSDVAFTDALPTYGAPYLTRVQVVGRPAVPFLSRPIAGFKVVSSSYFRAVGLRLISGRVLDDSDRGGAPFAVVVNETFTRTYLAGEEPLGRGLLMRRIPFEGGVSAAGPGRRVAPTADDVWTVVGIVADEGVSPFDERVPEPTVYATRRQHPRRNLALVVRTSHAVAGIQESIRKTVTAVDRDQALADLKPLDDLISDDVAPDRLRTVLLTGFAAIAVALAALGLYGVMAHAVIQRTREIGIRTALGATRSNLLLLVARQAMLVVAAGLAAGVAISLATTRLLTIFLYGVTASDPLVLATAAGALTAVGLIACCVPAVRATRIDPVAALRA